MRSNVRQRLVREFVNALRPRRPVGTLIYKGHDLKTDFCPDLILDDIVVVELKVVERLAPVHMAQLVTYLKLTEMPIGLLMNFNVPLLKQGTHRIVRPDRLEPSSLLSPFSLSVSCSPW